MILQCPSCKARYRMNPARLSGKRARVRCPRCTEVFPITPEPPAMLAPPPTPVPGQAPPPSLPGQALQTYSSPGHSAPPSNWSGSFSSSGRSKSEALAVAVVAVDPGPFRERALLALNSCRARVIKAEDGPSCLDTARRTRAKLVIANHYLPLLTGPEIAAALRGEPSVAQVRIVIHGRPPRGGRFVSPTAQASDADALVTTDATREDLEKLFTTLLENDHPATPDEPEVRSLAKIVIDDLCWYHQKELSQADRSSVSLHLAADIESSIAYLQERHPGDHDLIARTFDEELQRRFQGGTG